MATIERDFGLKADEQGFLLGVKKLGQDVASIDTNVSRIIDILSHAPVQDFKDIIQQSQLSSDVAKIAVSSTALLEENKKLVTLLSSRTMGRGKAKKPPTEEPIIVSSDTPPTIEPPNGQPPTEPPAPVQEPPSSGDTAPPQQTGEQNTDSQSPQIINNERVNNRENNSDTVSQNNVRQRDSRGRFVGSGEDEKKGFLGKIVQAIKNGFSSDTSSIDPSIEAMREVGQVLEPVGKVAEFTLRPFGFRSKEKNKPLSRDEEKHNKGMIKLLKKIVSLLSGGAGAGNGGNGGGDGGGLGSGVAGGLAGAVSAWLATKLGGIGSVFKKVGKGLGGALKFGKGIPLIGTALSALTLSDWDKQNTEQRGESVGGISGGVIGGALGSVLGPVGTMAGAAIGSWVGSKLGGIVAPAFSEWTDSLIKADIPKRISNAWDIFTGGLSDYFKEKINNIKENTKEVVNDARDTVGSVGDFAAYQTDRLLAKLGNKEAKERLNQRDRGEIGFTPQNYKAKTTNNTSLGQVAADTGEALSTQPSTSKYAPLLDEIAKGESKSGAFGTSGYDAVYGGAKVKPSKPVSQMTIGEVKEYQKQLIKAGSGSSAVGRYQFIKNDDAFAKMTAQAGLKDTDIFDATAQDRLAVHYMGGEKKVDELLKTGNDAALANVVAGQWASMKNASGRGNYDGDRIGNFARHGGISAMQKARQQILANEAQPKPTNTVLTKAPTPIVNGLTTTPLAILPKAQTPAFSLMRPTQQVEVKPSVISQTQHKIAVSQMPKPESVKEPIGTPSPMMVRNVDNGQQITQNLSDRHLAHLVTGGLGMTDRWIR